jgi:hypothetical protein
VTAAPARAESAESSSRAGSTVPIPAIPSDPLAALGVATGAASPQQGVAPGVSAGTQSAASGLEPCPHCGTMLALDQRYCLQCGAPRTYLSGMLLERLRSPDAQGSPAQAPPSSPYAPPVPGGATGALASSPSPGSSGMWQRGSVLTLIAGIGVLLLAMGVGVLIGRSGGSSSANGAAPQIVTLPAATTGAASTTTTPTTPEASSSTKAAAAAAAAAKHKAKSEAAPPGTGSSLSKPAPPSVVEHERGGSGQSYEQKSKNLPNVVSTG